jgi:uncharacterized protein (TIGR02217 family)
MPTPFKDHPFPLAIAKGSSGGPGFNTTVVPLASGDEGRNINWSMSRAEYDISTGIRNREDMALVQAHFYVMYGKAYSFPFRDWADYQAADVAMVMVSSTVFQLVKRYTIGADEFIRTITKPIVSTVAIKVSGSPVTPSVINRLTGLVTFASPPGATPTATFQFDVPVRFDTDKLPVQNNAYSQLTVTSIPLIEVHE